MSVLASCQPGMSPQSASRGPVERVYVHVPRLWERRCPQRTAGGLGRNVPMIFVSSLEFQVGSCLLRDRSGLSQPFWHGVRGRSGRSLFKVHWNLSRPWVRIQRIHSNEAGFPRSF